MEQKKKAHLDFKYTNSSIEFKKFSNLRSQCKAKRKNDYTNYLSSVQNSIKLNPKFFWKFINDKKPNHNLPNLMIFNNEEAEGGQTIVNIFGKYFSSVYTQPLPNSSFKPNPINTLNSICNLQISLMDVFNELNNINLNLCSGPDNLSSTFLFECRFILSYPLHI